MRNYQLYLIEDEFADHYFGREQMFYQLFLDFERASGDLKLIIKRQIEFITKTIPTIRLHKIMKQQLSKRHDFHIKKDMTYYLEMNGILSTAKMEVYDRSLQLHAEGSYEAETIFFEVLRKWETSFLAVDLENKRYGWLKPIKERKFI
ncbi:sporulation inhibitor of replication protein SirA [Bacillus aquiflavi]|uniref:Sporulation inhibitor of replication protein SirA n=1 Tax=Bacillus aquiflavi TaxID=2672567 RepID=A0A6B3VZ20_9BACI|nr:sporulation inhibitor of replication protein SirA [Bacillus aquiflavi]MBA4537240.1 sporulation inhibitor of replication protein SirA [Bacillus aquiflavi]NEY81497.1 sporulation inhibitor of replication protein SirA [Bacillus aquiflavi]UAC49495.1 sporulation inhibitor of replication protein SirA [Bacillus aquiflavi]